MIYALYIYGRSGACLFREKWGAATTRAGACADPDEESRLLFGLIFSLKEFVLKMAPAQGATSLAVDTSGADWTGAAPAAEGLQRYQTDAYTCHHFETPSGLRFILMSDKNAGDLTEVLRHIYAHLYVDLVVNNPLSDVHGSKTIKSELFRTQLKQYIEGLACFR